MRPKPLLFVSFPLLLSLGCKNPCQALCEEMADFAAECGFQWDDAALQQCTEDQAGATPEEKETCGTYEGQVQDWWTCEDVADYFDKPASQGDSEG